MACFPNGAPSNVRYHTSTCWVFSIYVMEQQSVKSLHTFEYWLATLGQYLLSELIENLPAPGKEIIEILQIDW